MLEEGRRKLMEERLAGLLEGRAEGSERCEREVRPGDGAVFGTSCDLLVASGWGGGGHPSL